MIKCKNLSKEDIKRIGSYVSEAFLGEPGCFSSLPREVGNKMFSIIVETCYECGHLYTTSEKQEGFCAYWTKKERLYVFWIQIQKLKQISSAMWDYMLLIRKGRKAEL